MCGGEGISNCNSMCRRIIAEFRGRVKRLKEVKSTQKYVSGELRSGFDICILFLFL